MAEQYEKLPGLLYHMGKQFYCPCGNGRFKVEIGPEPTRFWCGCGAMYTEYLASTIEQEREEVSNSGV